MCHVPGSPARRGSRLSYEREAVDHWMRSVDALHLAEVGLGFSPDGAANRAYYAAFHAVSAIFLLEGKVFKKLTATENAVHHDLVKSGKWPKELGEKYKTLHKLRAIGDYGELKHVTNEEAESAVCAALDIMTAVHDLRPDVFDKPKRFGG
jgi:uncharacterized protein (UPF0332 family)